MNIDELIPFYALGALSDEEQKFVERYLAQNPDYEEELAALQEGVDLLALSIEPIEPDAATKELLMARVANDARPREAASLRPRPSWWQQLWSSRAAPLVGYAMALLLLVWTLTLRGEQSNLRSQLVQVETQATAARNQVDDLELLAALQVDQIAQLEGEARQLRAEVDSLEQVNETLRQELESDRLLLAVLRDPDVDTFALDQTGVQDSARGRFVVNVREAMALLSVAGLRQLPADQNYQFWLIGGDGPVDAGLLEIDDDGSGVLLLNTASVSEYDAIGLSIEPAGGSLQPTGDIVLLGGLQQ